MRDVKDYKEVEYKYLANNISLDEYLSCISPLLKKHNYTYKEASSSDIYFTNSEGEPLRFRNSRRPELTLKRKTTEENNAHRIEINLEIDHTLFNTPEYEDKLQAFAKVLGESPDDTRVLIKTLSKELQKGKNIEALLEECLKKRQYTFDFKIYKICEIYFIENINYVYYSVLDKNMKPLDNFIEIEYDEHQALNLSAKECLAELNKWENYLKPLGLNEDKRLDNSLYERYKN